MTLVAVVSVTIRSIGGFGRAVDKVEDSGTAEVRTLRTNLSKRTWFGCQSKADTTAHSEEWLERFPEGMWLTSSCAEGKGPDLVAEICL